jgi:hypothetical protein
MENVIAGSRWRVGALAAALAALAALGLADSARAGSYTVYQCSGNSAKSGNPGSDPDVRPERNNNDFATNNSCGVTGNPAIGIHVGRPSDMFDYGRWTWTAPSGTAITRASAYEDLRDDNGLSARVFVTGRDLLVGDDGYDGWRLRSWSFAGGTSSFGVRLVCGWSSGCDDSNRARAYLKSVGLTLNDSSPPVASVGGALTRSGWHRRTEGLSFGGSDRGSGVAAYALYVNGTKADGALPPCARVAGGYAARMRPCAGSANRISSAGNTLNRNLGWRDGTNTLQACAWDFSGTKRCRTHQLNVDNSPPELAFRNSQSPADPELIRARDVDPHSGVEVGKISYRREGTSEWHELPTAYQGGELRARVDSEAVPAGRYRFKAWSEDRAGNRTDEVIARENGQPMVLRFPLRADTQLHAGIGDGAQRRTVRYGKASKVTGRLRSTDGDPLAFQTVRVRELFDPGSLEAQHTSEAVTDRDGRFALRLPSGPSREVEVTYGGSKRFRPAAPDELDLNVRSGASFNTSRRRVPAGQEVSFGGKVKHDGVELPPAGKLVELQVREGAGRWGTVKEAFSTRGDGRYSLNYRFANFYDRPIRYAFRVKVTREQGWPYKAPVRTRARRVTVVP